MSLALFAQIGRAELASAEDHEEALAIDGLNHELDLEREHSREFVCYAVDARGKSFRARGDMPRRAQARAVDKCRNASALGCIAMGCDSVDY